jgi:hypothetical protein
MEDQVPVTVCLYSKYSEKCVLFFQDMVYLKGVRMLCIDNQSVREMIEMDSCRYDIQEVPCILSFFKNGRMDKYEGEDAFAWLRDRKQRLLATSKMVMSSLEPVTVPVSLPVQKRVDVRTMNPVLPEDPFPPHPVAPSGVPVTEPGAGPYTPGDPIAVEIPESERSATGTNNSNILRKKDNIMNMAMNMAKQRESEFEANDPKKRAQEAAASLQG